MSQTFYYDSRMGPQRERLTWAAQRLILAHVLVYAGQLILHVPFGSSLHPAGGLMGGAASAWCTFDLAGFLRGEVWRPFSYMWLHGGLDHLFFNMIGLFFFGPEVERVFGTRQFFRFYIGCGAVSVLATLVPFLVTGHDVSVVGASGAVMAVLVAFATVYPEREVFLFPIPMPINARAMVAIFIGLNLMSAVGQSNISVATHFGGMACGFAYVKLAPLLRRWRMPRLRVRVNATKKPAPKPPAEDREPDLDALGRAVDNIFKFEDPKRRPSRDD